MKAMDIKKVLIFDQGNPAAGQLLAKAMELCGGGAEYVILKARRAHNLALEMMEKAIREEQPELVLIGATALGEEVAPALGVRFETGIAAHCLAIKANDEGELTFMIPAFGGRLIGEIFVPGAKAGKPAIATVKPGILQEPEGWVYEEVIRGTSGCRVIDVDAMVSDGSIPEGTKTQGGFRLSGIVPRERSAGDIDGAELIVCGGYGLGDGETWRKLEKLADSLGGAAACTRAALDAEWGCPEESMIGTSGRTVRPKVYIGFGISGAAHHTCGITDAGVIININSDKDADAFAVSDYKGVFDAEQVIDALLDQINKG